MSDAQDALRNAWLGGPEDRLCGREQAKAWALRESWLADKKAPYGMYEFIRTRVRKTKDGKATGDHPSAPSLNVFFLRKSFQTPIGFQGSPPTQSADPNGSCLEARRALSSKLPRGLSGRAVKSLTPPSSMPLLLQRSIPTLARQSTRNWCSMFFGKIAVLTTPTTAGTTGSGYRGKLWATRKLRSATTGPNT